MVEKRVHSDMRDKFIGCLIGQCVGDAIGAAVEGEPSYQCAGYIRSTLKGNFPLRGKWGYSVGQYTDDSQLARELFRSYVRYEGFDPQDYAYAIRDLFAYGKVVDYGATTYEAATYLMIGLPWDESGGPPTGNNSGNGSAMRAAPIGLFFYDDLDTLVQAATNQSIITHTDSKSIAGARIIAWTTAQVVRGPIDIPVLLEQLHELVASLDKMGAWGLENFESWLELPPREAVKLIAGLNPFPNKRWQWISPYATTSVLWALYSFLRTPDDYWETICTAISCGGDVDTTAAMAGAISGAYLGISAIPDKYAQLIHDRRRWGYDDLVNLAECAWEVKSGSKSQSSMDRRIAVG